MGIRIFTNNARREIVDAYSLPADVRSEFDYLDWEAIENGNDSASFVCYRGTWFDLGDVPAVDAVSFPEGHPFRNWHGYVSDTFFSGTVFRYVNDDGEDSVIVGRYFAGDDIYTCVFCDARIWRREDDGIFTREVTNWSDVGDVSACPDAPAGTHTPHGNARFVAVWHGGINYSHGDADDAEWFGSIREASDAMKDRRNMGHNYSQTFRFVFRPTESALTPNAHDDNSGYMDLYRVDRNTTGADIRNAVYGGCPDYRIEFGPRGGIVVNHG